MLDSLLTVMAALLCCCPSAATIQQRAFHQCRQAASCPSLSNELPNAQLELGIEDSSPSICSLLCLLTPRCEAFCLHAGLNGTCGLFELNELGGASSSFTDEDCYCGYTKQLGYINQVIPLQNCSQSSVGFGGHCINAIDGILEQNYYIHPCIHTAHEMNRWWRAKLAWRAHVTMVTIYNRMDAGSGHLDEFDIAVDSQICVKFALNGQPPFSVRNFSCNRDGIDLKISSQPFGAFMFCEVQAWGFPAQA